MRSRVWLQLTNNDPKEFVGPEQAGVDQTLSSRAGDAIHPALRVKGLASETISEVSKITPSSPCQVEPKALPTTSGTPSQVDSVQQHNHPQKRGALNQQSYPEILQLENYCKPECLAVSLAVLLPSCMVVANLSTRLHCPGLHYTLALAQVAVSKGTATYFSGKVLPFQTTVMSVCDVSQSIYRSSSIHPASPNHPQPPFLASTMQAPSQILLPNPACHL